MLKAFQLAENKNPVSNNCSFSSGKLHRHYTNSKHYPAPEHVNFTVKGMGFLHIIDYRRKFRTCFFSWFLSHHFSHTCRNPVPFPISHQIPLNFCMSSVTFSHGSPWYKSPIFTLYLLANKQLLTACPQTQAMLSVSSALFGHIMLDFSHFRPCCW